MKKNISLKALVALVVTISMFASVVPVTAATSNIELPTDPANQVSGVVRAIMATSAGDTGSPLQEMVLDTGREIIPLEDQQYESLNPGEFASIRTEQTIVEEVSAKAQVADLATSYSPIPDRRLLIVPVQWAGSPFSSARMTTLNATVPALRAWWSSVSLGVEALTVNVLPIQEIAVDTKCDYITLNRAAVAIAEKLGFDSWYTNLSLVLPDVNACWWGGLGMMPGNMTWMNSLSVKVFAHELGHNMGLAHANACIGSTTVSFIQKCNHNEYGDPTDVMGYGKDEFGYNAAYLRQLGWLSDSKIQVWTSGSVNVNLSSLRDASGSTRAIRIPAGTVFNEKGPGEYWIQFRNESSFWPRTGVYMNLVPTTNHIDTATSNGSSPSTGRGIFTWLCDLTPNESMDGYFEFVIGKKWNDPLGRFSVTVTAVTATSATVNISPSSVLPVIPQSVSATPEVDADGSITGSIRVSWTSTAPVSYSQTEPAQWIATTQEGKSCVASVTDRSCLISGSSRLVPITVGVVGRNYAGFSASRSIVIQPLPLTPPSLTIKIEATSSDATVTLTDLDSGGSSITALSTTVDDKTCVLSGMSCSVSGLFPNSEYKVVVIAQNSIGSRRIEARFKTSYRIPKKPLVSFVKIGDNYEMRAALEADELNNVSRLMVYCNDVQSTWMSFDAVREGVTLSLPEISTVIKNYSSRGETTFSLSMSCHVVAWNEIGRSQSAFGATPWIYVRKGVVVSTDNSSDSSMPSLNKFQSRLKSDFQVSSKRIAANTYEVSWRSTGVFARSKPRVVVPRAKGRLCVQRTSTSCVFRNLMISKPTKVVVHVYKQSSDVRFHGTKVIRVKP